MKNATLNMWDKITHITTSDLKGAIVADIGCGPGRFIETIRDKKGIAIGLDLSDAVEAGSENFAGDENVLICQADVLKSPIRTNSVDYSVSIGVLHHSNKPEVGFKEMVRTVKPDGTIAVSVYSRGGYYQDFFVTIWRKIFKALWPIFGHYPALIYSYVVVYVSKFILMIPIVRTLIRPFMSFFPFINLKDTGWSVLNTFDSITPSNQYGFTPYEVYQWFKHAKLKNIEPSNWAGASWVGKK